MGYTNRDGGFHPRSALVISAIAGYLGFTLAIGALFAGLAFSREPQAVHIDGKFSYFYELFTPFFFIQIGMHVDSGAMPSAWCFWFLRYLENSLVFSCLHF